MDVKWVIWIFIGSLLCLLFCNTYYIKIYKPFPYSWTNIRNIFKQPSKEFPNKVCLICLVLSHWLDFWVIILKIFKHPSTGLSTNMFTWNLWNHSMSAWYMYMHFLFSYKLDTFSTKSRVRMLVKIFLVCRTLCFLRMQLSWEWSFEHINRDPVAQQMFRKDDHSLLTDHKTSIRPQFGRPLVAMLVSPYQLNVFERL